MQESQLLENAIQIASNASDAILEIYDNSDIETSSKADNSPLTLADLAADRVIKEGLMALQLNYPILTEETAEIPYDQRKNWNKFWLVDPLDGTKEFIKRNGEFTVNIALIEGGIPVLGVVYVPVQGVCYFASAASGAYIKKTDQPAIRISVKKISPDEMIRVVASRSHADRRTELLLENLGAHECISMGSSLKLCAVAEGSAHFYPRLGPTMEWDTAAAHAIVLAAGGRVCNAAGNELSYNKPDLHNPEFFVLPIDSDLLMNAIKQFLKSESQ